DAIVCKVYSAIKKWSWENTLLLITYDEHGGFYDSVPPPTTAVHSPDGPWLPKPPDSGPGCDFTRLGVRVPAVVVSAYTKHGADHTTVYEHASIPRTVADLFEVPTLTNRDESANSLIS